MLILSGSAPAAGYKCITDTKETTVHQMSFFIRGKLSLLLSLVLSIVLCTHAMQFINEHLCCEKHVHIIFLRWTQWKCPCRQSVSIFTLLSKVMNVMFTLGCTSLWEQRFLRHCIILISIHTICFRIGLLSLLCIHKNNVIHEFVYPTRQDIHGRSADALNWACMKVFRTP